MNNEFRQIVNRAARTSFEAVMRDPFGRWQLWHAPGNLILVPAGQDVDGMEPVPGSIDVPWKTLTGEQFALRIADLSRTLPILEN